MSNENLFRPEEAFFVIESDSLAQVRDKLYGFAIVDNAIVEDVEALGTAQLTGDGAYVCIRRQGGKITIEQDFIGSYGLYLYRDGDYFALGNSFQYLVEQVKRSHRISFDRDYANYLLTADLCSAAFSQTMVREIAMLDRAAVVEIDMASARLDLHCIDYRENTVALGSHEGMAILDGWYRKWTALLRNIRSRTINMQVDLTGGFDSRMTIALLLGAGFDPGDIKVYSADDDLHTHREDYKIASAISSHYGFRLNNFDAASLDKVPNTMEDILNISFYAKLGFHKQMYYSRWKHQTNFYYMGGSGGECVRDYWNMSPEAYIQKAAERCRSFPAAVSRELEGSVRRVLERSFAELREKFRGCCRELRDEDLAMNLYRETRCRNHFGKDNVEHYQRGSYKLNPLLDPDLHKLKLTDGPCQDRNLLMAVIFDRYSPDLLTFPFEGGRSVNPETAAFARKLNVCRPYLPERIDFCPGKFPAAPESPTYGDIIPLEAVRERADRLFRVPSIRGDFTSLYGEKTFDSICQDIHKRSYFALQNAYVVICIGKVLADVRCSENTGAASLADWLQAQLEIPQEDKKKEASLKEHPYLANYFTARVDIKNGPAEGNDIVVLEISDEDAKVTKPKWFAVNGNGCIIEAQKGRLEVTFRCIRSGKLNIALRGRDVRNARNKRVPFWIDYGSVKLNGEEQLRGVKPVWHDAPLKIDRRVKDGEIITLSLEWAPHDARNDK